MQEQGYGKAIERDWGLTLIDRESIDDGSVDGCWWWMSSEIWELSRGWLSHEIADSLEIHSSMTNRGIVLFGQILDISST